MDKTIKKYFSILIESLYQRTQSNFEEEDLLLCQLDVIWHNLTIDQAKVINKILKEFKGD
jgi:hypothetical protein